MHASLEKKMSKTFAEKTELDTPNRGMKSLAQAVIESKVF